MYIRFKFFLGKMGWGKGLENKELRCRFFRQKLPKKCQRIFVDRGRNWLVLKGVGIFGQKNCTSELLGNARIESFAKNHKGGGVKWL